MPPRSWCDSCDLSSSFARLRLRPARVLDTTSGAAFLHSDRVQRERVHIEERGGVREVDRDGAGPAILVHRGPKTITQRLSRCRSEMLSRVVPRSVGRPSTSFERRHVSGDIFSRMSFHDSAASTRGRVRNHPSPRGAPRDGSYWTEGRYGGSDFWTRRVCAVPQLPCNRCFFHWERRSRPTTET